MMRQLLYFSHASREMSESDLLELLVEARESNTTHDVTGLLIYVRQFFIQCLEGHSDSITQLMHNIKNDERNQDFTVLLDRDILERGFPEWTMGFRSVGDFDLQQEAAFLNVVSERDLDPAKLDGASVLKMMRRFYMINDGVVRI